MRKMLLLAIMTLAAATLAGAGAASAAPQTRPCGQVSACLPITVKGPIPFDEKAGPPDNPIAKVVPNGYVSAEYFLSGTTNVFNYNHQPAFPRSAPGAGLVVRYANLPYTTRAFVVAPSDPAKFSGDVVIEFMNSSASFDSAPEWIMSNAYFGRSGYAYIGVTTSANQSIAFLKGGCHAFGPSCGTRYASLQMTDNGQEYEIISDLVTALKSQSGIPASLGLGTVRRVYVSGHGQQGGSVITHANAFSFPLVDGYLISANVHARALGGLAQPADLCGGQGAKPYPDCFATLPAGHDLIHTNLPMPINHLMTEADVIDLPNALDGARYRQPDTDTAARASYRLVEIPATAHFVYANDEILPGVERDDPCTAKAYGIIKPIEGYQIANAMWRNMRRQVVAGTTPPNAPRITTDSRYRIVRDSLGNAEGGVRLPELDAPTNSYYQTTNTGKPACGSPGAPPPPACEVAALALYTNLVCVKLGSYKPLSKDVIDFLYHHSHAAYVRDIAASAQALHQAGFLEGLEVSEHIKEARASGVAK